MHLHHELQRALADTKISATTPPPPTQPEEQPHARTISRRVLLRLPHRPARRDRRATRTLGAKQHWANSPGREVGRNRRRGRAGLDGPRCDPGFRTQLRRMAPRTRFSSRLRRRRSIKRIIEW